jgi:hypothetical protein
MPAEVEVVEGIQVPSVATLKQYGLTRDEWVARLAEQGYVCPICDKKPVCTSKRCKTTEPHGHMHTEHQHVAGWKKMPPEKRKKYVRGIVCQFCNRFVLARTITLKKARAIVRYLKAYKERRNGGTR